MEPRPTLISTPGGGSVAQRAAVQQMYAHEINTPHPALAAYLLGQGLRSVIRSVLEDVPAQLESPALLDSLVAMALGCLRMAPAHLSEEHVGQALTRS